MSMVLTAVDHLNQATAEATDSERCDKKTEETAGTGTANEEGANTFTTSSSGEISIGSVSMTNANAGSNASMAFGSGEADFGDSGSITVASGNAHQQAGSNDMASSSTSIRRRVIIPRRSKTVPKCLCTKDIGEGSFDQDGGGNKLATMIITSLVKKFRVGIRSSLYIQAFSRMTGERSTSPESR